MLLNAESYSTLGLRISDILGKLIAAQLANEFCVFCNPNIHDRGKTACLATLMLAVSTHCKNYLLSIHLNIIFPLTINSKILFSLNIYLHIYVFLPLRSHVWKIAQNKITGCNKIMELKILGKFLS